MTDRHTYTGKELTTLLEQVRRELGSEATIVEANKVRSGGVAGFFATETYEVVATSAEAAPVDLEPDDEIDLDELRPTDSQREVGDIRQNGRASLHTALLDRADAISVQERIELSRPVNRRRDADVLSQPGRPAQDSRSETSEPLGVPFIDVLTDELGRAEPDAEPFEGSDQGEMTVNPPVSAAPAEVVDAASFPSVSSAQRVAQSVSPSAFWARVEAIEEDFVPVEVNGLVTSIVGELDACLQVAGKLEFDASGNRRELLVVTQVDSLPIADARIVRTNNELDDLLRHWLSRDRECVVVVDRRVGARATSHLRHARLQGPGVQRVVVTDRETPAELLERVQRFGHNSVVDLVFAAEPSHVIDLIEAGVPIATVAGHQLDQPLLAALACCVSNEL